MSLEARPRVVFVDDDPLVLRSIRRLMKRSLSSWELVFAASGAEALEAMQDAPADIVVSDLNMGRMDGAVLLQRVQDATPEVVRIVLSGSTSRAEACSTARSAHQFLAKPFDSKELSATLRRAASMRSILDAPELRRLVAGNNDLPSAPALYVKLTELLSREDASLAEVASIIEREPSTAARLLQMTSSAFIGRRTPPRTIRDAVVYVGMTVIQALVLTHHIVTVYQPKVATFSIDEVQRHALMTGALASKMLANTPHAEDAFLAGMMHAIGRLVLASRAPRLYRKVLRRWDEEAEALAASERSVFGATHAEAGAYLLGLWGLPHTIVHAVASCHRPTVIEDQGLAVASAVHIASRLALSAETPVSACGDDHEHIDAGLVERIGSPDLEPWRQLARSMRE